MHAMKKPHCISIWVFLDQFKTLDLYLPHPPCWHYSPDGVEVTSQANSCLKLLQHLKAFLWAMPSSWQKKYMLLFLLPQKEEELLCNLKKIKAADEGEGSSEKGAGKGKKGKK